jgi:hypothetical protein
MMNAGLLTEVEQRTGATGLAELVANATAADASAVRRTLFGFGYPPADVELIAPGLLPQPGEYRRKMLASLDTPLTADQERLAVEILDNGRGIAAVAREGGVSYNTALWASRRLVHQRTQC